MFARPAPLTKCLLPENRIATPPPGRGLHCCEARSWRIAAKRATAPGWSTQFPRCPVAEESGPPLTGEPLPPWTPTLSGSGPEQWPSAGAALTACQGGLLTGQGPAVCFADGPRLCPQSEEEAPVAHRPKKSWVPLDKPDPHGCQGIAPLGPTLRSRQAPNRPHSASE